MKGFHTATPEQIKAGAVSDVYFQRTAEILDAKGVDAYVRAEFVAKSLPGAWEWAVFAGLAEVTHLLEGIDVVSYWQPCKLLVLDRPVGGGESFAVPLELSLSYGGLGGAVNVGNYCKSKFSWFVGRERIRPVINATSDSLIQWFVIIS